MAQTRFLMSLLCVSFQGMRLSWFSLLLKACDGQVSLVLSTRNTLHIYQDQGQWRPWPLSKHCTGLRKGEAPYTGNRVELELLELLQPQHKKKVEITVPTHNPAELINRRMRSFEHPPHAIFFKKVKQGSAKEAIDDTFTSL